MQKGISYNESRKSDFISYVSAFIQMNTFAILTFGKCPLYLYSNAGCLNYFIYSKDSRFILGLGLELKLKAYYSLIATYRKMLNF